MKVTCIKAMCIALAIAWPCAAKAAIPDHPVITEIYQDAPGAGGGGPVGADPDDPHQEFIEIYLPPLADLSPALNKDALNLTFYSIEGDASSPEVSLVNYRIDLPTFDLDPSNGLTGLPRPPSGMVVLGWVAYFGNPPTTLLGDPTNRVALINGGITSATDFTFIAINGNHFNGTQNFPVPDAVSYLDTHTAPFTGIIEQGSGAFLLVNRDDPGYAEICGITDPNICSSFPNLVAGNPLGVSSLLDGFAANDDNSFEIDRQPYSPPTGDDIDLEFVLPQGGAFTPFIPQVPEEGSGYQRRFIDSTKTSEDGIVGNENPALDAANTYIAVSNLGPFFPTPGYSALTTSPAQLSIAIPSMQTFQILKNTLARPALVSANIGGNFGMEIVATPGGTRLPTEMNLSPAESAFSGQGMTQLAPYIEAETFSTTQLGHSELVSIKVEASSAAFSDPVLLDPTASSCAAIVTIDPTTGKNAAGGVYQATAFFAVQGISPDPAVTNEFILTSLGSAISTGLGTIFFDSRGAGATLVNPSTDFSDPLIIDPLIATMPTDPAQFINPISTGASLVTKVLNSAEVASGATTYNQSFNASQTLIKAREFIMGNVPTTGGFIPTDRVHYSDPKGATGKMSSGLTDVMTRRDFELALIDTQLSPLGTLESGATDDFGIAVRVAQTGPGAMVAPGEIVFLSTMGGLEGADIDSLDVPPYGNLFSVIYVDLENLNSLMGVQSIDRVYVIDGSGNGEVDVMDVFQLPEPGSGVSLLSGALGLAFFARQRFRRRRRYSI